MATILLVDDWPEIRALCGCALSAGGHDVLTAEHGAEAVSVLESNRVDLVVTDVVMPEVDGIELLQKVRLSYPDIKVIGMSGGATHIGAEYLEPIMLSLGAVDFLRKPFGMEVLRDRVAKALFHSRPPLVARAR